MAGGICGGVLLAYIDQQELDVPEIRDFLERLEAAGGRQVSLVAESCRGVTNENKNALPAFDRPKVRSPVS